MIWQTFDYSYMLIASNRIYIKNKGKFVQFYNNSFFNCITGNISSVLNNMSYQYNNDKLSNNL